MKFYKISLFLSMVLNAQEVLLEEVQVNSTQEQYTKIEQDQNAQNLTSVELEKNSITSTSALGKFFPSLKIYPQGSDTFPMITIRGITGPDFYSFVLGLYVDGIPQSSNFLIQNLGDVESVRLINGSEGLLYGENAPLGLISIQSKNPLAGNYAKVSTSASFLQEELKAEIGWNLIEDKLWGKANVSYLHDNGFLKDPASKKMLNSGDSVVLGTSLYYQPTAEILLMAHYSYYYSLHHKDFFLSKSQVDSLRFESSEQISGYEEYTKGVQNKIFNKDPFSRLNAHNANVKLEYFFGDSTLSVVSAFQKADTLANSYPGIFVKDNGKDGYYYNTLQLMEELRLHTLWQNNLETLFGIYYKFLDLDNGMENVPTESLGYNGIWRAIERVNTLALYGNVSIPFGKLTLHTGLRYQLYHNNIDVPLPPTRPAILPYKDSAIFHALNPRVSLNYDIDSNHQVFLQLSNSSKPGGFSKFPFADTDTIPYKQEQILSLEFGNHSKFLNSALRFDSALYSLFIFNTQAYVGEGYNKSITNIGNAYSVGLDAEISYQGERWNAFLNGNLGFSQFSKGGKNIGSLIVVGQISPYNVSGLRPRFSPILSFSAGADVVLYQNQNHKLTLGSLLNFTTSYFLDDFNREKDLIQPSYATLDLSLYYAFFKHYELTFFAKNVTNTRYITSVLWDGLGKAYTIGNPLDAGIKFTYTY